MNKRSWREYISAFNFRAAVESRPPQVTQFIPVPALSSLGTCQKLAVGRGGGNKGGVTTFRDCRKGRGHEKWAVKRGRVMQICVRDHVEVHPQKKKGVLYFVKKKLGEIAKSSDKLSESE